MSATIFIEGSLCLDTGAAGWGAVSQNHAGSGTILCGPLKGEFGTAVTLMELAAVASAVEVAIDRGLIEHKTLTLALRSTAALAVLRWVFPDAPFTGASMIDPPKRLKQFMREAPCLELLSNAVERAAGLKVCLCHCKPSPESRTAAGLARKQMHEVRDELALR